MDSPDPITQESVASLKVEVRTQLTEQGMSEWMKAVKPMRSKVTTLSRHRCRLCTALELNAKSYEIGLGANSDSMSCSERADSCCFMRLNILDEYPRMQQQQQRVNIESGRMGDAKAEAARDLPSTPPFDLKKSPPTART